VLVAKKSEIERRQLTESLERRRLKEEKNVSSYHARRGYCGESFPNTNPAAATPSPVSPLVNGDRGLFAEGEAAFADGESARERLFASPPETSIAGNETPAPTAFSFVRESVARRSATS
jgi:hypothetical protein